MFEEFTCFMYSDQASSFFMGDGSFSWEKIDCLIEFSEFSFQFLDFVRFSLYFTTFLTKYGVN